MGFGFGLGFGLVHPKGAGGSGEPPEFITDGDMSSATNWTATGDWSIAAGVATWSGAGGSGNLQQNFGALTAPLLTGNDYVLSFDLSNPGGNFVVVSVRAGLTSQVVYSSDGTGTIVVPFTAGAIRDTLRFTSSDLEVMTVDNVSLVPA